jgi:hypothetical protein
MDPWYTCLIKIFALDYYGKVALDCVQIRFDTVLDIILSCVYSYVFWHI